MEEFDSINWDEFWQKKFDTSLRERTQGALDNFDLLCADHRKHAERVIENLEKSFPTLEFAAENWTDTWAIYVRTNKLRKVPAKKMEKLFNAANRILENVEKKYPLESLSKEQPISKSGTGCLGVALGLLATTVCVLISAALHFIR